MAEPIYLRVRRVLSASAEETVDRLERVSGASLMRESIRQVDRALDEVRDEHEAAAARGRQAKAQQKALRERAKDLEEKARFALGKDRDDLAEAAIASQLDLESQAERLDAVQSGATEEAKRLEECIAALTSRKVEMVKELAAHEAARRDASPGGEDGVSREQSLRRKVERAEQAFDRAMGACAPAGRGDADGKVAEIDELEKASAIAERLAALKSAPPAARRGGRSGAAASPRR